MIRRWLQFCYPEVENLDAVVLSEKEILGFEVAMNNVTFMCGTKSLCNLDGIDRGGFYRKGTVTEPGPECLAF